MTEKKDRVATATEEIYRTLIESMPHIVWVSNLEGEVTFLNKAWKDWTGREVESSRGTRWAESLHPDDAPGLMTRWEQALSEGAPFEGECRFVATDGSVRHATFIGLPVRDDSGQIVSWVGANLDVTAVKNAQKRLQEKVQELEKANKLMIDRELKMIALKEKIKQLEAQLHGNE